MKKYLVSMNNIEYLLSTEIEAKDKQEAIEKYQDLWEQGQVIVSESELVNVEVKEV